MYIREASLERLSLWRRRDETGGMVIGLRSGGKVAEAGDGGGIETLNEGDNEIDGAIVIGAIDDAVVTVSVAGGYDDGDGGNAAITFLDFGGIVAVDNDEFVLQRNGFFVGGLTNDRDEFVIGEFAGVIEKNAGTCAQNFLSFIELGAGNVAGDARFEGNGNVWFYFFGGSVGAAQADLFLNGGRVEKLIGMGIVSEAAHDVEKDSASGSIVPSFAQIISGAVENGEWGVGNDGIARLNAQVGDFVGIFCAEVEIDKVASVEEFGALVGSNEVGVAKAGDGMDGTFGAEDDPALADECFVKPSTQHLHSDVAIGSDAPNHGAEFVHVGVEHDARAAVALCGDDGAEAVVGNVVGERGHAFDHNFADRLFETGRPGSFGQKLQELRGLILRGSGEATSAKEKSDGKNSEGEGSC